MNKKDLRALELECMFQPRYSGEDSERIWSTVRKSEDRTLYDFGCALQSAEARFLAVVNAHVVRSVRATATKRKRR